MKNSFLIDNKAGSRPSANIFANRSGLVLHELLLGQSPEFGVRELARTSGLSNGLVQRVINELGRIGIAKSEGVRTSKQYRLEHPGKLLKRWFESYSISDKCRFYTYSSGYSMEEIEGKLSRSKDSGVVLALHAAARAYQCGFTNLKTIELYFSEDEKRIKLEKMLRLEPRDRGYEVLLIKPYYSSIVAEQSQNINNVYVSSPLLALLDLYHFALRGYEQAEHLLRKHPELKALAKALKEG
jgi:hypothetical protein